MPGPLRFANPMLAGQITWLFPLAILGARLAKARSGGLLPSSRPGFALLLWAGWFGTHGLVFSFAAGIFHEYYTAAMGPAVAALAAIGSVTLRNDWRRGSGAYLVPATLMLTAAWQSFILGQHADTRNFVPVMVGLAAIGTAGLTVLRNRSEGTHTLAACSALGLLLIGPAAWSLFPVIGRGNSMMPTADPSLLTGRRDEGGPGGPPGPMPGMEVGESRRLVEFLRTNRHGETIFLAAPTSMVVSPIIIRTGEAAVSLGGFMGADPVLSKEQFARLVEEGQLRFVLIAPGPGSGGPGGPGRMPFPPGGPGDALGGPGMEQSQPDGAGRPFGMPFPPGGPGGPMGRANTEILMWVREHGKVVDSALWRDDVEEPEDGHSAPEGGAQAGPPINPNAMFRRMRRMTRLYDLRPDLGLIAANP